MNLYMGTIHCVDGDDDVDDFDVEVNTHNTMAMVMWKNIFV